MNKVLFQLFLYKINFFSILFFGIKLLALEFCDFFLFFFPMGPSWMRVSQVNTFWFRVFFIDFFIDWAFVFFLGPSFKDLFFLILISYHIWRVSRFNLGWLEFFSLIFLFLKLIFFYFHTLTLRNWTLKIMIFITFYYTKLLNFIFWIAC